MYKKICILFVLVTIVTFAQVDIGGSVKSNIGATYMNEKLYFSANELAELDYYLPYQENSEAELQINLTSEGDITVKKMYIKYFSQYFDFGVGRQPISWSYGSLLNPIDFNIGAEAMDEETAAKNIDAVEIYYPINWSSGVTGVMAVPKVKMIEPKLGLRLRTNLKGFDLTTSFVKEAKLENGKNNRRIGISGKGDIFDIGFYGGYGYYIDDEEMTYIAGIDYSFMVTDLNKLTFQIEYLNDKIGYLNGIIGGYLPQGRNNISTEENVIAGSINFGIDEFSNIRILNISSIGDKNSAILGAEYSNTIGAGIDYKISGLGFLGDDTIFGLQEEKAPTANFYSEFTYAF